MNEVQVVDSFINFGQTRVLNLKSHFAYLKYLIRHKWYVLLECWKRGLYWMGVVHDLSKFLPSEWLPYHEYFYTDRQEYEGNDAIREFGFCEAAPYGYYVKDRFNYAWLKHIHRNKHHWQYWILREDDGSTFCLPMPDKYAKEMLCDWIGAGKAIKGKGGIKECSDWYLKNRNKILIHNSTRCWIEGELGLNIELRSE